MIRFLQNNEIDRVKWDRCIGESRQGLIYGMSWYLDLVSPGWSGLEEEDYSSVMPLPVKKKYNIQYIIQPLYAQQLGVFSKNKLPVEKTIEFVNSIPANFKFIALNLNFDNNGLSDFASYKMNNNFELALNNDYKEIVAAYSANTRRNIQKASGITLDFEGKAEELIRLKKDNTGDNRKPVPAHKLFTYLTACSENCAGFICKASFNNEICAAAFFLKYQKRIYYLIPVSNPIGKEKKAMFAIIDSVIQKFAGSPVILDFEGSNIPGLARFFEGFAAINHPYPSVKINRLPFPFNHLRKS